MVGLACGATSTAMVAGCVPAGGSGHATAALTVPKSRAPHISRVITVDGTTNVRDIGGYAGAGGKHVRWRTVFRGAALYGVSKTGVSQLAALHLREVVDVREQTEIDKYGADIVPSGVKVVQEPVSKPNWGGPPTDEQIIAGYRAYVSDSDKRAHFGSTLKRIADGAQRPILVNCDTGESRTGWEMAVLLTTLGVARSQVEKDYELSNTYVPGNYAKQKYLDAAFDEANKEYGSFDNFLHRGLGVDQATVRKLRSELLTN